MHDAGLLAAQHLERLALGGKRRGDGNADLLLGLSDQLVDVGEALAHVDGQAAEAQDIDARARHHVGGAQGRLVGAVDLLAVALDQRQGMNHQGHAVRERSCRTRRETLRSQTAATYSRYGRDGRRWAWALSSCLLGDACWFRLRPFPASGHGHSGIRLRAHRTRRGPRSYRRGRRPPVSRGATRQSASPFPRRAAARCRTPR